ncbi:MAG: hypothetical protein R3A43_07400 [Bacteroidia bacterium]
MIAFAIVLITYYSLSAQMVLTYCEPRGGSGNDGVTEMHFDASGNKYLLITTASSDYPVTSGTAPGGASDLVLEKYDASNNLLFSIFLSVGNGMESASEFILTNNKLYVAGTTTSTNFPTTDGSTYKGNTDAFVQVYDLSGNLVLSKLIGTSYVEPHPYLQIDSDDIYAILNTNTSFYLPITTGGKPHSGAGDVYYARYSQTGTLKYATYFGGTDEEWYYGSALYNDTLLIVGSTLSYDIGSTDGSVLKGDADIFFYSANNSNAIINLKYFGGSVDEVQTKFKYENGIGYLLMPTNSSDLPVSNNIGVQGYYFTKVDMRGKQLYASYFGYQGYSGAADYMVNNGKTYFITSTSQNVTTTDGSSKSGASDLLIMVLNANNNIEFSGYYGGTGEDQTMFIKNPFYFNNGNMYFLAYSESPLLAGGGQLIETTSGIDFNSKFWSIAVYNSNYQLKYSGQITSWGERDEIAGIFNDKIYIHNTETIIFTTAPITQNGIDAGYSEVTICYPANTTNTVTPSSQTKCKQGLADLLDGNKVELSPDSFPPIYINNASYQNEPFYVIYSNIKYQWQTASTPTGPWTNIAVGVLEDYLPSIGNSNAYYRRIAKGVSFCSGGDTSNVVSVLVNSFTAPTVDAGGVKRTCPNSAVTIGGSPTATGGATPYTYSWDLGSFLSSTTIANPVATVPVTTVFEVMVTDNNGCKQIDQVVVMAHAANAGPDKGACAGVATLIEAEPVVGYTGVTYSWSPSTGLSATNIAQPMANPGSTTTYTLTQVLTKSGGGTCTTTDQVIVTPVSITGGFAGADKVICRGSTASLGASPQSGFTYTWAPGNYLTSNNASTTTFNAGNYLPNPNPFTYYLTATKAGCTFVDNVVVSVIEANAGDDGCGPRMVGVGDQTPNINETWTWTKISGGGNFSSGAPTNTATTNVTATPSGSTTYQLTASYGGTTCTDQVIVPQCGCAMNIAVSAPHGCPKKAFGDTVWLTASGASILDLDPDNFTYSWSATGGVGLSSTTGRSVYLTNGNAGTVSVTATSILDPSFSCGASLAVNTPSWSLPTFSALQDTICSGTTVSVGQAPVSGYSYLWSGAGLSSTTVSNPNRYPNRNFIVLCTSNRRATKRLFC